VTAFVQFVMHVYCLIQHAGLYFPCHPAFAAIKRLLLVVVSARSHQSAQVRMTELSVLAHWRHRR